jgi:lipid A disaccharide synthetase
MLSADFLKTAQLLRRHYPALEIVVPLARLPGNSARQSASSAIARWRRAASLSGCSGIASALKTAQLLRRHYPALEIVVPLVNARRREQFEKIKAGFIRYPTTIGHFASMHSSAAVPDASNAASLAIIARRTFRCRTCWPGANWLPSCCRMNASRTRWRRR